MRANRKPAGLDARMDDRQDKKSIMEKEIFDIVQTFEGLNYLTDYFEENLSEVIDDIPNASAIHQLDWKDLKDEPMGEQERQAIEEWCQRYGTLMWE